jgi:hypothetical protein
MVSLAKRCFIQHFFWLYVKYLLGSIDLFFLLLYVRGQIRPHILFVVYVHMRLRAFFREYAFELTKQLTPGRPVTCHVFWLHVKNLLTRSIFFTFSCTCAGRCVCILFADRCALFRKHAFELTKQLIWSPHIRRSVSCHVWLF